MTKFAGLLAGANTTTIQQLDYFGKNLGIAYQIRDDVFDFEANPEIMGKAAGMDHDKINFVTQYGVEKARTLGHHFLKCALDNLAESNFSSSSLAFLKDLSSVISGFRIH